jgi:hypothetical protein
VWANFIWHRLRLVRHLVYNPSRYFFAQEHRRKDPGQCFPAGVLDQTLGHWGTLKTPETAREDADFAQIRQGRAPRNDARRRDAYFLTGAARLKKLLVPCRRRMRRFARYFAGYIEASPPVADDA